MSNLMYPPLPNCHTDYSGHAILPDGRKVNIRGEGYIEGDTNAFVESGDPTWEWDETGEELTDEEINQEVEHEGHKYFLHEFVWEHVRWDD